MAKQSVAKAKKPEKNTKRTNNNESSLYLIDGRKIDAKKRIGGTTFRLSMRIPRITTRAPRIR